jgi:hypothetical protein
MRATVSVFGIFLGVGVLLTACEDVEEFEITGPALEEVLAAQPAAPDGGSGVRIHGTRLLGGEPLIFINGVRMSEEEPELDGVDPKNIEKVSVIKGTKAVERYGPDAKHGVILITLKDSI